MSLMLKHSSSGLGRLKFALNPFFGPIKHDICHKIVETGRLELDIVQNCKGVLVKCSETTSMIYKWKLRIAQ